MKKIIKITPEAHSKLSTKRNELIAEQGGKNITFSGTIERILENGNE